MSEPGAWVVGHRVRIHGGAERSFALCSCDWQSRVTASIDNSCLALVDHLQRAVRRGAAVMKGDEGTAGDREPRRPLRPLGTAGAELLPERESRIA